MHLAITKEAESLDDLAARVYAFGGRPSAAEVRAAAKSLLEANPGLRRLADLPPGTAVLVPPLENAEPSGVSTKPLDVAGTGALLAEIRATADQVRESLRADVARDLEAAQHTVSLLRSSEVKRAAGAAGTEEPAAAAEAARQRVDQARAFERTAEQVFRRIDEDARELLDAFGS